MAKAKPKTKTPLAPKPNDTPSGLRIKLQIAATVFVPMAALGLWLNSKGFFG
jgi:hypothetical protein